ncbi:hypothetical protein Patl1_35054 [Pistacia atlantica]|uniref:Uncharacterized protein n=1 Tax=Pistacia atlantica TaxID=434234 RepID=A0ACC0ZS96_9ROSI|nr:hypothetical protein Patl1_35054 [Pistacia atlantica]
MKVTKLRSFLGLSNYYQKFIASYFKKATSLTNLLRKGQQWEWTKTCDMTFNKLKESIASKLVSRLPNFELPFEVHMDALEKAIGGVLVQEGHLIAFES